MSATLITVIFVFAVVAVVGGILLYRGAKEHELPLNGDPWNGKEEDQGEL